MKVSTPNILWHGGGNEKGKPDRVLSIDLHPLFILATAGIDASIPPKGSVGLWHVDQEGEKHDFIVELCDHQSSVNALRFSPCGSMLASASDRQIIIYTVLDGDWGSAHDRRRVSHMWLRPSLSEMYDIAWSPDCTYIIACSIDQKSEIIRVSNRDSVHSFLLPSHASYVQGCAWDPLNGFVVTQSADRSLRSHALKSKPGMALKLSNRGHFIAKMFEAASAKTTSTEALTAADFDPTLQQQKSRNLFADSTVPSFFRRPSFSPDGALLVAPTGVYKNAKTSQQSFCTHVFSRSYLTSPIFSLVGLEDPSVAVRFSPVLYQPVIDLSDSPLDKVLSGAYRMVFAVLTVSAVMVYDTQHPHPLARLGGLHLACINDACWSADGNTLIVCSSDGYLSFISFEPGALGKPLPDEKVPDTVKNAYPLIYGKAAKPELICSLHVAPIATAAKTSAPSLMETHIQKERQFMNNTQMHQQLDSENNIETHVTIPVTSQIQDNLQTNIATASVDATTNPGTVAGKPEKKKQRITPIFVGALGSSVLTYPSLHSSTLHSSLPSNLPPTSITSETSCSTALNALTECASPVKVSVVESDQIMADLIVSSKLQTLDTVNTRVTSSEFASGELKPISASTVPVIVQESPQAPVQEVPESSRAHVQALPQPPRMLIHADLSGLAGSINPKQVQKGVGGGSGCGVKKRITPVMLSGPVVLPATSLFARPQFDTVNPVENQPEDVAPTHTES